MQNYDDLSREISIKKLFGYIIAIVAHNDFRRIFFYCVGRLTAHTNPYSPLSPMAFHFSDATQLVFHHVSGRQPARKKAEKI